MIQCNADELGQRLVEACEYEPCRPPAMNNSLVVALALQRLLGGQVYALKGQNSDLNLDYFLRINIANEFVFVNVYGVHRENEIKGKNSLSPVIPFYREVKERGAISPTAWFYAVKNGGDSFEEWSPHAVNKAAEHLATKMDDSSEAYSFWNDILMNPDDCQ